MEVWFKTADVSMQPLFNYGTASNFDQFSVYAAGAAIKVLDGTDTLTFSTSGSLANGAWHHLVVTYDGATTIAVYIDGSLIATKSTSGSLTTASGTVLQIGTDGSGFFNGAFDEAAVYSIALSSSKVLAHYHAGQGD